MKAISYGHNNLCLVFFAASSVHSSCLAALTRVAARRECPAERAFVCGPWWHHRRTPAPVDSSEAIHIVQKREWRCTGTHTHTHRM